MTTRRRTPEQALLLSWDEANPIETVDARDLFFEAAVADWWWRAWPSEKLTLLENFGFNDRRAFQLSIWSWEHLPRQVRSFLVQHALSGKPMEYLR